MIHPWKYTIIRVGDAIVPLIHSGHLEHKRIAQLACHAMRDGEPISAGFISGLTVGSCHGISESLGIGSDRNDAALINLYATSTGLWPKS